MKFKIVFSIFAASVFASGAFAQKYEVFGDYSYIQFNPTVTGFQSRAFNGGGGGFQINFGQFFGLKGDFQGYASTQNSVTVRSPIGTSAGIIPIGTYKSSANMFTYMFGPVARVKLGRAKFFGEVLMGGSNTNLYGSLYNQVIANGGVATKSDTQHPYTMAVGGGIDYDLNHRVTLRLANLDWILTRYTNPFTNTNNQNNFRYYGGVVVTFGGVD